MTGSGSVVGSRGWGSESAGEFVTAGYGEWKREGSEGVGGEEGVEKGEEKKAA
jgi:hypothetical protein